MAGFARVTLIGNLGKDPEVRFTAGGMAVANLRVACTEKVKVKDAWEEKTEWVSVVCFGATAENAGKYLAKGSQLYAEGRMQTREWQNKEGAKQYSTEVVANSIQFLGGKKDGGVVNGGQAKHTAPKDDAPPPLSDDDIPF